MKIDQKIIAYWFMGIAGIILIELLLGEYLHIPENLDNCFYMIIIVTILTISSAFIEIRRVEC
jgi:hypothetical protein